MAFLFGQLFLCVWAHHLEHGGNEDDEDNEDSRSHLMSAHLPCLFHLSLTESDLREELQQAKEHLQQIDISFPVGLTKKEIDNAKKLRKKINVLQEKIHEATNTHWTVNQFTFWFSVFVFIGSNGYWCYEVSQSMKQGMNKPLHPEPGRNWYALSFANPSFLPTPGDTTRCTGSNSCPAGW